MSCAVNRICATPSEAGRRSPAFFQPPGNPSDDGATHHAGDRQRRDEYPAELAVMGPGHAALCDTVEDVIHMDQALPW